MPALAAAGWRALAPDLAGFGDSPLDPPGTWERQVEALERFRREQGVERCVPVVHDWGALIGLRWACEHPDAVAAPRDQLERLLPRRQVARHGEGAAHARRSASRRWRGARPRGLRRRAARVEPGLRRRGDRRVLEVARRRARTGATRSSCTARATSRSWPATAWPTWTCRCCCCGARATSSRRCAGAHRFQRELPDTELVVIEGAGHFVWDEQPERCAGALTAFLERLP